MVFIVYIPNMNRQKNAQTYQSHNVNTCGKTFDKKIVHFIVQNNSSRLEIQRYQCFVVAIIFVATGITDFGSVTRIMQENGITTLTLRNNIPIRLHDIGLGWGLVITIIYHNRNVIVLNTIKVLNVIVL